MTRPLLALSLGLALLTSCAASAGPVEFEPLADGTAPRPFTAEQIAAAFQPGHWNRYRFETAGAPAVEQVTTVTDWTAERVRMTQQTMDGDAPVGEPLVIDAGWTELREHAAFPAGSTELVRGPVELECGTFDCLQYTVRSEQGGTEQVARFSFSVDHPGPPVLYSETRGGEPLMTMTLLDWRGR